MTTARAFFEHDLLPVFAGRFLPTDLVLNVGAGRHGYREHFPCRVVTADPNVDVRCDETFAAEQVPYDDGSVAGVLMMGVFERLDDPMQAMRELRRVTRPGGFLLISLLNLRSDWRKPCDRWRVSASGVAHVARAFSVLSHHEVGQVHFAMLQKPQGSVS